MTVSLRGLGAMSAQQCRASSSCSAFEDIVCYGPGYLTEFCTQWRAGIDPPPTVQPPQIDTTPGSPTYGQATLNRQVVVTSADAGALIDRQQIQQIQAWQAQNQQAMDNQGADVLGVVGSAVDPLSAAVSTYLGPALLVLAGFALLYVFGGRR